MINKITVKQLSIISAFILLIVSLGILLIAHSQKKNFHSYFDKKYGQSSIYFKQTILKGYNASTDEIHILSSIEKMRDRDNGTHFYDVNAKAVYKGEGFTLDIYEIYNRYGTNTFQIIYTWKNINSISYLKKIPFNSIEFDYFSKNYMQGYYPSPKNIYHNCLEYYKEKYIKIGGEETKDDIIMDLMRKYRYYKLFSLNYELTKENYGNDYFSIDIGNNVSVREAKFDWEVILNDIFIYFLLIVTIPFILFIVTNFRDSRFFCFFLIINIILVLSSYHICDNNICSINTYKTIWPFTTEILEKKDKEIFLGHSEFGGMLTKKIGEEIVGLSPLEGYDISEFIVFCFFGYLVYRSKKK